MKIIIQICLCLFLACSCQIRHPITIFTNLCEETNLDSINNMLSLHRDSISLKENGEAETILSLYNYTIVVSTQGYCFYSVVDVRDYYLINVSEYIVGYDLLYIYDKLQCLMYQSEIFNLDGMPYVVQYKTCNFNDCSIKINYKENKRIETIHFYPCVSDTIILPQ